MKSVSNIVRVNADSGIKALHDFTDNQSGVLLCREGTVTYIDNGEIKHASTGDLLVKLQFSRINVESLSRDFKGILCAVDMEFVYTAVKAVSIGANMQYVTEHSQIHPTEEDIETMLSIIELIENQIRLSQSRPLTSLTLNSLWHALAYHILNSYVNVRQLETNARGVKEAIMLNFHNDLTRDCSKHRTVAHYAQLQNLSPRYFSTSVKEVTGKPPLHWISLAVVAEAKRLMRDTNMSIKEIGYELSFTSPTFFSRWFRQFAGETPTTYRTRRRITLSPDI